MLKNGYGNTVHAGISFKLPNIIADLILVAIYRVERKFIIITKI
jgi:hypothetical protein